MTRNSFKKFSDTSSRLSEVETLVRIPPWCSSGRVCERRKPQRVQTPELKYPVPLRENAREQLADRTLHAKKKFKKCSKSKCTDKNGGWKLFIIFSIISLTILYKVYEEKLSGEFRSWLMKTNLITLSSQNSPLVDEHCCYRLKYLVAELSRSNFKLRTTARLGRTIFEAQSRRTDGAVAVKGAHTAAWGARVALWGVIPLWRAAPPPDTILALREPTPSDCWPFSGSHGEIEIYLPSASLVSSLSLEHIRPDTAHSAPKDFSVYGILENGTWIKAADGTYRYNKPAKQYYSLDNRNAPLKRIVFRVLSNHGNLKYTCVYRVHLYTNYVNNNVL